MNKSEVNQKGVGTQGAEAENGKTVSADKSGGGERQVTEKQFTCVVFLLALATKMFVQPIFLIQTAGRDAYLALAIDGAVDLVILGIIVAASKLSPDTDFFMLLKGVTGEVCARIVVGLFGLFMLFKLTVTAGETISFYAENIYTGFDVSIMSILLILFAAAASVTALRALCRLNEIITPLLMLCIAVIVFVVVATGFDVANILPVLRKPQNFESAILRHASWLGDFTPMLLFVGRTKITKHSAAITMGAGVLGTAVPVFFCIVMCAAFGNVPYLVDSSTNLSSVLQYTVGNLYGRLDIMPVLLWSVAAFIENALFFYCASRCFEFAAGKVNHLVSSAVIAIVLFFVTVFVMTEPMLFSQITANVVTSAVIAVFSFGMPLLALICAIVNKRKNSAADKGADGNTPRSQTGDTGDRIESGERND